MLQCPLCKNTFRDPEEKEIRRREWIETNSPEWRRVGAELKNQRLMLGVPLRAVADALRLSESTIRKFEAGEPVQRGTLVEVAYRLYINSR